MQSSQRSSLSTPNQAKRAISDNTSDACPKSQITSKNRRQYLLFSHLSCKLSPLTSDLIQTNIPHLQQYWLLVIHLTCNYSLRKICLGTNIEMLIWHSFRFKVNPPWVLRRPLVILKRCQSLTMTNDTTPIQLLSAKLNPLRLYFLERILSLSFTFML